MVEDQPKAVIQKYVANPLLIKGRKFEFRVYLLVASVNPVIAYYHEGFLKIALNKFDPLSKDFTYHVVDSEVTKEILDDIEFYGSWNNLSRIDIDDMQKWNFRR